AREAAAAEEAAKNNGGGGGGGGGGNSGGGGGGGGSGWVRPQGGYISSGYGWRPLECSNGICGSTLHAGTDLANGCGAAIYAASSGTVTYAGMNGGDSWGYGNYISIDHGGGIGTGYGHIRYGGILVSYGEYVRAGQIIAYAGNTGASLGCHLHFEVYIWGETTNPVPFLANRGVYL
ncbi:MAG: M23 family metallopeptidase, partial [Microbacterium sp.]